MFFKGMVLKINKIMNDWYEQWSKAGAGPNFEKILKIIFKDLTKVID